MVEAKVVKDVAEDTRPGVTATTLNAIVGFLSFLRCLFDKAFCESPFFPFFFFFYLSRIFC